MLKVIGGEIINISAKSEKKALHSRFQELIFVIEGSSFINKDYLSKGQGCFFNCNSEISIKPDKNDGCIICRFSIDGEDNESILLEHSLVSDEKVKFILNDADKCFVLIKILASYDYSSSTDEFCQAAAKLLFSFIKPESTSSYIPVYSNHYVDRAVCYINENISSELRVEKIANVMGIDRMYMRNLFFEHLGMSTMDYIMQARISRAKELLQNSKLSVTETANSVGYRDVLAFSKAFKKYTDMSPTEFRAGAKKAQLKKKDDVPIFIL